MFCHSSVSCPTSSIIDGGATGDNLVIRLSGFVSWSNTQDCIRLYVMGGRCFHQDGPLNKSTHVLARFEPYPHADTARYTLQSHLSQQYSTTHVHLYGTIQVQSSLNSCAPRTSSSLMNDPQVRLAIAISHRMVQNPPDNISAQITVLGCSRNAILSVYHVCLSVCLACPPSLPSSETEHIFYPSSITTLSHTCRKVLWHTLSSERERTVNLSARQRA